MPNSVVILDQFHGPASALLASHTPNEGGPWTILPDRAPQLDGLGPTQWLNTGGLWILEPPGELAPQARTPSLIAGDVTLAFVVQDIPGAGSGEDALGAMARWTNADHFYTLSYRAEEGAIAINKQTLGGQEEPQDYFTAIDFSQPQPLLWQISGADHAVWLPNGSVHTWTDPDSPYTDPGAAGIAGDGHGNATPTTGMHLSQLLIISGLMRPMP